MKYSAYSLLAFTVIALTSSFSTVQASPLVASSGTTVSNISFRLIDLDTRDGVSPWIRFNNENTASTWIRSSDNEYFFTFADGFTDFEAAPLSSYSKSLSSPDGSMVAKFGPNLQETAMSASGDRMVENQKVSNITAITSKAESTYVANSIVSYETGVSDPFTGQYSGFTLSPKTAIIFSGIIDFKKSADFETIQNDVHRQADGWTDLNFSASFSSTVFVDIALLTGGELSFVDGLTVNDEYSFEFGEPGQTKTTESKNTGSAFSVRLDNDTRRNSEAILFLAINDSMILKSSAYKTTDAIVVPPPPIPEPSTYALMLLGLAGMAGVVRGQRRTNFAH